MVGHVGPHGGQGLGHARWVLAAALRQVRLAAALAADDLGRDAEQLAGVQLADEVLVTMDVAYWDPEPVPIIGVFSAIGRAFVASADRQRFADVTDVFARIGRIRTGVDSDLPEVSDELSG